MRIGVDVDGVLTDLWKYETECGKNFFHRNPVNPNTYSIPEMFECSKMMEFIFGLFYFPFYCKQWPIREGAKEALHQMEQDGHELYLITARKFIANRGWAGQYSRKMLMDWLGKNDLRFFEIHFCTESHTPEEKYEACCKEKVSMMIDDRIEVASYMAQHGILVLLFDAPYNQGLEMEGIKRVKNWKEVYLEIGNVLL